MPEFRVNSHWVTLIVLFLISYAILFGLSLMGNLLGAIPVINFFFPSPIWNSPMYWLLPIVGFFGIYFVRQWAQTFFPTKFFDSKLFPVLFVLMCIIAVYVAQFFLYLPTSTYTGRKIFICMWDCPALLDAFQESQKLDSILFLEFSSEFKASAFMYFMFAGLLSWCSWKVMAFLEKSGKL